VVLCPNPEDMQSIVIYIEKHAAKIKMATAKIEQEVQLLQDYRTVLINGNRSAPPRTVMIFLLAFICQITYLWAYGNDTCSQRPCRWHRGYYIYPGSDREIPR
jgi:hypothetical protein